MDRGAPALRAGFVGAGHIAEIHAGVLGDVGGGELVAVADADGGRARSFADAHGVAHWFTDVSEMLGAVDLDVVHVLVPPAAHAEVAERCLRSGCHVFVEKPLTLAAEQAEKLYALAEERNLVVCVDHNYLFEAPVREAIGLFREGELGNLVSVDVSMRYDVGRNPDWTGEGAEHSHWAFRLPGGPLEDLFPHPASLAAAFLGNVTRIRCLQQERGVLPDGFPDELRVLAESRECIATIHLSLNERPDTTILRVNGTRGTVVADLYSNSVQRHLAGNLPRAASRALSGLDASRQQLSGWAKNIARALTGRIDQSGGIGSLMAEFYRSLASGVSPPIGRSAVLNTVRLTEEVFSEPCAGTRRVRDARSRRRDGERGLDDADSDVLVTGASGFIGSHLLQALIGRGESVRAMVRPGSPRVGRVLATRASMFEGDLADADALRRSVEGIRTVYHLGGAVNNDPEDHRVTTIEATRRLLDASLEQGVRSFVYVSSLAVCDTSGRDADVVTEDVAPAREMSPYAEAKLSAEKLVIDAADQGLSATIVRPGIVVGPRGRVLFPHMGYAWKDKVFVTIGDGNHPLPLVYVENLVTALIRAGESPPGGGEIINVVDRGRVTANEYLDLLIDEADLDASVVHVPWPMVYVAAGLYEASSAIGLLRDGLVSRAQLQQKRSHVSYDVSKAERLLDWRGEVPIREGLKRTFRWYGEDHAGSGPS